MPEIVEVERLRKKLEREWVGKRIDRIELIWPQGTKFIKNRTFAEFQALVQGEVISNISRYGKFLSVHLSRAGVFWHIHLSSTGWWAQAGPGNREPIKEKWEEGFIHPVNLANARLSLHFDPGRENLWYYHDPRTWGKWWVWNTFERMMEEEYGPDWLLNGVKASEALEQNLSKRTAKSVLTDQKVSAGLGNYLACEILFRCGVHPHKVWVEVQDKPLVTQAIRTYLSQAMMGPERTAWKVFMREGERCSTCAMGMISYLKDAGSKRGSYFCPICQP